MRISTKLAMCLSPLLASVAAHAAGGVEPPPLSTHSTQLEVQMPVGAPFLQGTHFLPAVQQNDVDGSERRYQQYITYPQGGYIDRLQLDVLQGGFRTFQVYLDNPGEASESGGLRWQNAYPFTRADLTLDGYRFYLYPEAGDSFRRNWWIHTRSALAGSPAQLSLTAGRVNARATKPGDDVDWAAQHLRLGATQPIGSGDLDLALTSRGFESRNGLQPNSHLLGYSARYTANLPRLSSLGLDYATAEVNQGTKAPRVQTYGVRLVSPAASSLVATARLDARRISGAVEQTAYTRSSNVGRVDVSYRGVRGLLVRAGYDRRELERVNRFQDRTDKPVTDRYYASASYRPWRRWQVVGKASHRISENPPASDLNDRIPLLMNLERSAEVRFQGTPTDNALVYAAAGTRFRKNTRRNLEVEQDTTSVGGWVQLGSRFSLNADYSYLWTDSRNLQIQTWLSDARVTTVGGNFTPSSKMSLDTTYTRYRATRAQDASQETWGVNLWRPLPMGARWGLEFRRDVFSDGTAPANDYTANVVSVRGAGRF